MSTKKGYDAYFVSIITGAKEHYGHFDTFAECYRKIKRECGLSALENMPMSLSGGGGIINVPKENHYLSVEKVGGMTW